MRRIAFSYTQKNAKEGEEEVVLEAKDEEGKIVDACMSEWMDAYARGKIPVGSPNVHFIQRYSSSLQDGREMILIMSKEYRITGFGNGRHVVALTIL